MAAKSDLTDGTIALTNGSIDFTGTGTSFAVSTVQEGDEFKQIDGQTQWEAMVATITDNTHGTLVRPWGGATGTYAYRLRYMADGARMGAQARNLIELLGNGNLQAFGGLAGSADRVPMFTGPGAMTLVPKTDLVSGAAYDVQVANLTARAAYDGQSVGYAVLVSNVGDGRAAIYAKNSATSGDWSAPAYVTGPVGPNPTITIDTTTTLAPGSSATVVAAPVAGGIKLNFGIPEGRGAKYVPGGYNPANAFTKDQAVLDNGSTWIALQAVPAGNAPPVLPTTSNVYWGLLARAGNDGTGTGDVVGPASAVDDRLAAMSGATGKVLKDAGISIDDARIPRGHLSGLILSNNAADAVNDIDIAAGQAASSDAAPTRLVLAAAITKRLDAAWAAGSGNGGLDTGAIANTTYHVFLIQRSDTGMVDVLFSTSPSAPTMPASYNRKRRIGFVIRAAGAIVAFKQYGDVFKYVTETVPLNSTTNYTDAQPVIVPSGGVKVVPQLAFSLQNNSAGNSIMLIGDGDQPTARISVARAAAAGEYSLASSQGFVTDTAGQLRYTFISSGTLSDVRIFCQGWIDGRDQ